eukprot:scaffold103600_cov38-Tisochrysis_lutea.AAC.1
MEPMDGPLRLCLALAVMRVVDGIAHSILEFVECRLDHRPPLGLALACEPDAQGHCCGARGASGEGKRCRGLSRVERESERDARRPYTKESILYFVLCSLH